MSTLVRPPSRRRGSFLWLPTLGLLVLVLLRTHFCPALAQEPTTEAAVLGIKRVELVRFDPGGQEVWSGSAEVAPGWTTFERDGNLIYVWFGAPGFYVSPDLEANSRFYFAYFEGFGSVFAREVEPGEAWAFREDGITRVDSIGHFPKRVYRYNWTSTFNGEVVAEGEAEVYPGWTILSVSGKHEEVILFSTPEATLVPGRPPLPLPQGRMWVRAVLPGAGEVYATIDRPGQVWLFTSFGSTVTATPVADVGKSL